MKLSRKKKELLKKLGLPSDKNSLENISMRNTVKEIKEETPRVVSVIAKKSFRWDIAGIPCHFLKGRSYVMAVGTFFKHRKNNAHDILFDPSNEVFSNLFKRYDGQNLDNKTLLIWRFGGIGDLMFTQPLIKYIKEKHPTCRIIFSSSPRNLSLFETWPEGLVDETVSMPFPTSCLYESDYHLTFEGSIERCKEAHTKNAYDIFKEMAGLDFNVSDYEVELLIDKEIKKSLIPHIPLNTVAIQLKASSNLRTLPVPNVVNLMAKLQEKGYTPAIIDSSKEAKNVDYFLKNLDDAGVVGLNLAKHSIDLKHCIAILDNCKGIIATDSATTHLAAAIRKPVLGLFGPFVGDIRMRYYETGDWIDASKTWNLCNKAPCFFHDNDMKNCPFLAKAHPPGCLQSFKSEEIIDRFERLVEKCNGL